MIREVQTFCKTQYDDLSTHPIYNSLNSDKAINIFMQHHIYSVWDFMNLLKFLQARLTCISVPWVPFKSANLSRLINEIVLEEESDLIDGKATSHFMYYYEAIIKLGIDAPHINQFIYDINKKIPYKSLISQPYIPSSAQKFMSCTYDTINESLTAVAASFAFARESLVPSLFKPIVNQLSKSKNNSYKQFVSYLERHIELDSNEHSNLAFEMVLELISNDNDLNIIKTSAKKSLIARKVFWDDIYEIIK